MADPERGRRDAGKPAAFPGRPGVAVTEADEQGHFTVGPLRSGGYLVAAVKVMPSMEVEDLERFKASGLPVQVARGEKKAVALRVVPD